MQWTREERALAVESYFSSSHSITATQRAFSNHFKIATMGRVPNQKPIVLYVDTFKKTGNVHKKTGWFKNHQDTRRNRAD